MPKTRKHIELFCLGVIVGGLSLTRNVSDAGAGPQYGEQPSAELGSMEDCDQDHLASLAIRACTALINSGKSDGAARANLFVLRGKAWMSEQEPEEAAVDFTHALEIEPKNIEALERRARVLAQVEKHDKAAADWGQLIALKPDDALAYNNRAKNLLAAGQPDAAISDFTKALELSPKSVEAHVGLAGAYDAKKDRTKALEEFALALAIDPGNIAAHIAKAEAAERWGEPKLAIESYLAAVKYNGMLLKPRQALQRLGVETPTPH